MPMIVSTTPPTRKPLYGSWNRSTPAKVPNATWDALSRLAWTSVVSWIPLVISEKATTLHKPDATIQANTVGSVCQHLGRAQPEKAEST